MDKEKPFGLYLYKKKNQDSKVLKDLLQFLKTTSPSKGYSFSYIEADTSLHPGLTLWENLQLEIGPINWKDFEKSLKPEWSSLVNLLKNPSLPSYKAQTWERFLVSLLKGLMTPTQNLLIDMDENLFSPLLIQNFKMTVIQATKEKSVILASAQSGLWLDCAHSIVGRDDYKFTIETLSSENIKKHWAA